MATLRIFQFRREYLLYEGGKTRRHTANIRQKYAKSTILHTAFKRKSVLLDALLWNANILRHIFSTNKAMTRIRFSIPSLLLFCIAMLLALPSYAQSKRKSTTAKTASNKETTITAEEYMQRYEFGKAAQAIQREITAANRASKSTERLEADLARANMGQDMLRGTEKVVFIDSFVVDRDHVLEVLKFNPQAGSVVNMESLKASYSEFPTYLGQTAFINELADHIYFAATDTIGQAKGLWTAYRNGKKWGTATPLNGLDDDEADRDYPFVMPDGLTLYFAAQGNESLGGYDIFVTRYNTDTREFLKAENVGMPFNSPANDYLMGIDEQNGIGWFVTDRNQPADKVCVYVFIPSTTRDVYELTSANEEEVIRAARIASITDTQTDKAAVKEALAKWNAAKAGTSSTQGKARRYVINDQTVYTSLSQFKSEAARRIAEQADETLDELNAKLTRRDELELQTAQSGSTASSRAELQELNKSIPSLRETYKKLCKNMRISETAQ